MTTERKATEMNKQTAQRPGDLLGAHTIVTPLKSMSAPQTMLDHNGQGQDNSEGDAFQAKVNRLATHFIGETLKFTLIHAQHCGTMEIW